MNFKIFTYSRKFSSLKAPNLHLPRKIADVKVKTTYYVTRVCHSISHHSLASAEDIILYLSRPKSFIRTQRYLRFCGIACARTRGEIFRATCSTSLSLYLQAKRVSRVPHRSVLTRRIMKGAATRLRPFRRWGHYLTTRVAFSPKGKVFGG